MAVNEGEPSIKPTSTRYYNIKKPLSTENYDIQVFNTNFEQIDTILHQLQTSITSLETTITQLQADIQTLKDNKITFVKTGEFNE